MDVPRLPRLQYLARRTQTYNSQLQTALQKTGVVDMKTEQVGGHGEEEEG